MTEELPHIHAPIQHRDGKPPWCHVCGLTADLRVPVSRIGNHPAGTQIIAPLPSTEDLARKWFEEDEEQAQEMLGVVYEKVSWEDAHADLKGKYIRRVQEARRLR